MDQHCLNVTRIAAALRAPSTGTSDFELNPAARPPEPFDLRPASVLVPLIERGAGLNVILTRRAAHLRNHPGQIAFPGGRVDPTDRSAEHAALRETEEEIGLPPDSVDVLGYLDDLITVTRYRVTPVVARIEWPVPLRLSTHELSAVFGVPVDWLADPATRVIEYRDPPVPGPRLEVIHWPYNGFDIWGATARMILNLLDVWPRP